MGATSFNANERQQDSTPYVPTGQPKVLTDDASSHQVRPAGAGASEVRENVDFQSTAEHPQATQGGADARLAHDATHTTAGEPLLEPATPRQDSGSSSAVGDSVFGMIADLFKDSSAPHVTIGGAANDMSVDDEEDAFSYYSPPAPKSAASSTSVASSTPTDATAALTSTSAITSSTQLSADQLSQISNLFSKFTTGTRVYQAITSLLSSNTALTADQKAALQAVADKIATKNATGVDEALESEDASIIQAELESIYGGSDAGVQELLGQVATGVAGLNKQFNADILSGQPDVVLNALTAKADLDHSKLSPAEKQSAAAYLKMMMLALVFIGQLRQIVSESEGAFAREQSEGKIATSKQMSEMAIAKFGTNIADLKNNLQKNLDAIDSAESASKKKKLWGWLGPVIIALTTIVAIAISVGTIGTATPGAMAMLAAVIAATTALATIEIADQTTGFLTNALQKAGLNAAEIAAVKFAMNFMVVVASCGTAAGVVVAQMGETVAIQAVKAAIALAMQSLFSSGLVTMGFTAAIKAAGGNDEQQMIGAIVGTVLLMFLMIATMSKGVDVMAKDSTWIAQEGAQSGAAASKSAQAADELQMNEIEESARADAAGEEPRDVGSASGAAAGAAVDANSAADESLKASERAADSFLQKVARGMKAAFEEAMADKPATLVRALSHISKMMQLAASAMQAQSKLAEAASDTSLAALSTVQGQLDIQMAGLNACFTYISKNMLPGFDKQMSDIVGSNGQGGDIPDITNFMQEMLKLMQSTIKSDSTIATNLSRLKGRG